VAAGPTTAAERELRRLLGPEAVRPGSERGYLSDATASRGLVGHAEAVAIPQNPDQVAATLHWCYDHNVPLTTRGGGTGLAGGAVPQGGVVLSLERLRAVHELRPELWRMHVQAGLPTADVARLAREWGLYYPPDPGAAEQSQIGGNIATNAGGPHSFKYGVTGHWVTGLELVLAPGERVVVGGPGRKDVAGYDLRSLLVGSEGTLGIITAAWLRLVPAPEAQLPILATYPTVEAGAEALSAVLGSGVVPATIEFLDTGAMAAAAGSFPGPPPGDAALTLIVEADGTTMEAERQREELKASMQPGSQRLHAPAGRGEIEALWRWRSGVSPAVTAQRGGKLSEDIVVPAERLVEAIVATQEIGRRHGLRACSWGHAGDGNLHSTFMIDPTQGAEIERAEAAAQALFALAIELGGSVSAEHGLGLVKSGTLERQWEPAAVRMHEEIKRVFDPKGLLNPGKKRARVS
jgi:glycolate oxidase subunit GlcD